jgi:hypothetical protein
MASGYTIVAGAALSAATAKSAVNLISSATKSSRIVEIGVSFDGVTSSAVPVLVELCSSTQGAAGTCTAFTPLLIRGLSTDAASFTAGINYTVEPTTLVVIKHWYISPLTGVVLPYPLGREAEGVSTAATARKGMVLRLTAPAIVNYKVFFEVEEG